MEIIGLTEKQTTERVKAAFREMWLKGARDQVMQKSRNRQTENVGAESSRIQQNPADLTVFPPFYKAFFVRKPFIHVSQGLKYFEIVSDVPEIQLSYFRRCSSMISGLQRFPSFRILHF
jgi:hypothetical protein